MPRDADAKRRMPRKLRIKTGSAIYALRKAMVEPLSLGRVALDATKVTANASKHNAVSHERMLKSERTLEGETRAL